jgi:hypothetical protein
MKTRLCLGFKEERSWAVAKPMPDEPPVMTIVLGVDFKAWNSAALGLNSAMM